MQLSSSYYAAMHFNVFTCCMIYLIFDRYKAKAGLISFSGLWVVGTADYVTWCIVKDIQCPTVLYSEALLPLLIVSPTDSLGFLLTFFLPVLNQLIEFLLGLARH